jgi:hypothetical protein
VGKTDVRFYAESGQAPALEWLAEQAPKVKDKFRYLIELLVEKGHVLPRPYAAPLRDKIYELRVRHMQVNYRLLYFFHDRAIAILAHGCTKEAAVDDADIDRALARRKRFVADPKGHTYAGPA